MSVSFKIALRFLRSSKGQTILIVLGIAIGIAVQIFIGSLISGLQASLIQTTIGNSSQITVLSQKDDGLIENYSQIIDEISSSATDIKEISPVLDQPALILTENKTRSVLIRGLEFERADSIYNLQERLTIGKMPQDIYEVVIGKQLAENLSVDAGEEIEVTVLGGVRQKFKVTGIFDLKVSSLNESWFLTTLESVQTLFDQAGKISAIEMQVAPDQVFAVTETRQSLENTLNNPDIKITDWKTQNQQLLSGLSGQSVSSYMIQFFVVISVVLGIASVLAISVLQKSKQIGILKAMGIKRRKASLIFFYQGFLLGILGGLLGVAFGLGLAYSFTIFAKNPEGEPIVALLIDFRFLLLSFILAVAASSLASLIPARKSARLDPIEVIRNG